MIVFCLELSDIFGTRLLPLYTQVHWFRSHALQHLYKKLINLLHEFNKSTIRFQYSLNSDEFILMVQKYQKHWNIFRFDQKPLGVYHEL